METFSMYLAFTEKELEDCIRTRMETECERMQLKDCNDSLTADPVRIFLTKVMCQTQKKTKRTRSWFFKKKSDVHRCYVRVARRAAAMILPRSILNSVANV